MLSVYVVKVLISDVKIRGNFILVRGRHCAEGSHFLFLLLFLLVILTGSTLFATGRFPEPQPSADHREEDVRVDGEPRRLPALGHDLRQLPEAA